MKPLILTILLAGLAIAGSVQYTYDAAGRLILADYGNGKTIAYTYDASGNLTSRTVTTAPSAKTETKEKTAK